MAAKLRALAMPFAPGTSAACKSWRLNPPFTFSAPFTLNALAKYLFGNCAGAAGVDGASVAVRGHPTLIGDTRGS